MSLFNTLDECYELVQVLWLKDIQTASVFTDLTLGGSFYIFTQVIDISKEPSEITETHIPDFSELLDQFPDITNHLPYSYTFFTSSKTTRTCFLFTEKYRICSKGATMTNMTLWTMTTTTKHPRDLLKSTTKPFSPKNSLIFFIQVYEGMVNVLK